MEYIDIADRDEDERIQMIGETMMRLGPGKTVAFVVDTSPGYEGKGDRYLAKLQKLFPQIKVAARFAWPVAGTETIKLGL